jgi:xylan 1,4-beta-xylosidase
MNSPNVVGRLGIALAAALSLLTAPTRAAEPPDAAFPVTISVDAAKRVGEMRPIWRYFGADEPNYAYMKDGRKLIKELGELGPHTGYFRAHNLLTTGDGTPALKWGSTNAYTEDADGKPVYDWTIVDRIFDTYLERGVKPYVQIGFMPRALSTKPEPYQHKWTPRAKYDEIYTGWAYPPKDYEKWAELVFQWTKHCVERYGRADVETWWWQVWNEPNIGYWRGTPEEFHKLYDYSVDAVKRALPTARVGGPEAAGGPGGKFMRDFFEHCLRGTNYVTGKVGTPLDFLSFHAKGQTRFVDAHVRMGVSNQLRDIDAAFALIAKYPELKGKPIVIGESDPDGCAACQGPQLGYRNGTMYSSYTAASFARKYELADRHGVNLEGALTWAFAFEDQPYFAGFRQLATNGIDLPVLNVFRMFGKMGGDRVAVRSSADAGLDNILKNGVRGAAPDVHALAALEPKRLAVMVWHYHDDDLPGPAAAIEMMLRGLSATVPSATLQHYRIDRGHSNAYTTWLDMGSPQRPTPEQYTKLEHAGQLATLGEPTPVQVEHGSALVRLRLPRQAVSLLVIEWK